MKRFTFENGKVKSELLKKYDVRSEEDMLRVEELKQDAKGIIRKIPLKQKVITVIVVCIILSILLLISESTK